MTRYQETEIEMPTTITVEELDPEVCLDTPLPWKCLLYNDEYHTMNEVVVQILKATGCSIQEAVTTMLRAHHFGQAVVVRGSHEACLQCELVLREIDLRTYVYQ